MNIDALFDAIATDYQRWHSRSEYAKLDDFESYRARLSVEEGRKYLKVVTNNGQKSVWGFHCKAG